jgi:ABC-type transporter Mla subunit MlaD
MSQRRSWIEGLAAAVARATEPITRAAMDPVGTGLAAGEQGLQVTEAITAALVESLTALPSKLRELELPSAKRRLEEVSDQLRRISDRFQRLSRHLDRAATHLAEPALEGSGKLIANGFDAAAKLASLVQPDKDGLIRLAPRILTGPYLDAVGTMQVGLRAAGDLTRLVATSLPSMSSALKDISEDLGRSAELLDATGKTLRELSELTPL